MSTLDAAYVSMSFSIIRLIDSKNRFDSSDRSSKMCQVYSTLGLESLLQRLVHTCLGHNPLNSTDCLFVYGCAVQMLLTVQYTRTHIMWVLIK